MIWRYFRLALLIAALTAAAVTLVVIIYWPNWEPWKGLGVWIWPLA